MRTRDDRRGIILRELFIQCSEEKYPEMSDDRFFLVSVTAAVIAANINDLVSKSEEIQKLAKEYLNSPRFYKHATILGIEPDVIHYIANNQDKQLETLGHYHQEELYIDLAGAYENESFRE